MSDPNRATLITVGAPKSAKANVIKTVRLTINLDESNESKYPELNYKELVFAEESQRSVQNGKTSGLDPFSDNDDVERVARKFEQKYGGKSTYGRKKARSKQDDFADIGAGYDENDSFIDNTHGYDEMIPPECDTLYGGFYINSGSLEFKTVPHDTSANPDEPANRRNKRRISSSSSEDDSSDSSSDSDSGDGEEKDTKAVANGDHHSHKTEHRKKKNKKIDKKKAKKVRRTDSSAATSGKQTSDENNHGDAESADCADSRTSQSDSLTSKPAPSSENAITSDSSRDIESKAESKLPSPVSAALDTLEALLARSLLDTNAPTTVSSQLLANSEPYILRLEQALKSSSSDAATCRAAWSRAAASLGISRHKLMQRLKLMADTKPEPPPDKEPSTAPTINASQPVATTVTTATTTVPTNNKRKHDDIDNIDVSKLTDVQRDDKIAETLQRLKALIDERKPSMLANYNAECERVQEERKKLQIAQATDGAPHVEKRLPKRRFPWCPKSRTLLSRLTRLAVDQQEAALLLAKRALPLFPNGFVRMPTLLRQADLSKEIKISEAKRQRLGSASQVTVTNLQPPPRTAGTTPPPLPFAEPIQFPSSLTVTTSTKTTSDKMDTDENDKFKTNSVFGTIKNTFSLSKDLIVEKDIKKDDLYVPPNNIGCITITPVPNASKDKKTSVIEKQQNTGLIRVKSPAALNDMVNKKDLKVIKKLEKTNSYTKDKRVDSPLHIDISYQPSKKDPSPKDGNYTLSKKDPSPKESNYQSKRDPSPKESNYQSKKDPSLKESSYQSKKDPSPKESNYQSKKDPSLKESSYQSKKDPSPKESNYQSKKDSSSKESTYSSSKIDPSPKGKDEVTTKQLESMRHTESNLPRPTLVPVHHSPTFAKPDKRPPELKKKKEGGADEENIKKKDLIVVSDLDPLSDISEPVNIDDSSSDVEVIEVDKSDSVVPSKDKSSVKSVPKVREGNEDAADTEIDKLMRNLREMEHSQEPTKFNSHSYGGVITSAKHGLSSNQTRYPRFEGNEQNKFTERTSLNKMDGSESVTG